MACLFYHILKKMSDLDVIKELPKSNVYITFESQCILCDHLIIVLLINAIIIVALYLSAVETGH